ncbi:HET-domain-containing protein [Setomelanomma holmii]|uniref:HET-domain-containing protein n=1 Tax=Setomelanomma holmii TaxID=210430 RepID=A0A9P4GWN5_9PLEO|nr:HET-domain-containing protein [Setomelanomma holmii]
MRLLKYEEGGDLTITLFDNKAIPPYAILSHTWGADTEEVTFVDLVKGCGQAKRGYQKIRFCGEQARKDGLQYFWIDTCCIDKTNKAELSQAINSMFRWYRNSARCYVYLSDVSSPSTDTSLEWFTRGWTLQELLAPSCVEFFSKEHTRLGDTRSLTQQIHEITGIPRTALQGVPLTQFNDHERFSWIEQRQTKIEEDKAYSLLGIFGIEMPLRYGEGSAAAFKRLEEEIFKLNNCLRDLCPSNPRNDKKRIEDTKGGLLADSYYWVLDNTTFRQWQTDSQNRLLWVKGDPGKGKTMLLCGIIDELQKKANNTVTVSYFFCQATDSRINSATAVLRGLLYMLVKQQPSLVSHIRKKHDDAGITLFEDANAWFALTEIFVDVLQDTSLNTMYLVIDALDECVIDQPKLLAFIAKQSSLSSHVKWIVSSRNLPDIEEQLEQAGHKVRLSLELNAESVSAAVGVFIQHKVSQLAKQKNYDKQTRDAVFARLTSSADGTFLWVALVCQDLEKTTKWNALKKLNSFPPGLDALYERMMLQISVSDDAKLCKHVLALNALLYRPITLEELVALAESLIADETHLRQIISFCGSFLTLREDTVYFVHQSAKDFLFEKAYHETFLDGSEAVHRTILSRSLAILSRTLRRDMYSLESPGYPIENVELPEADPLAASRYPCIYWIDHLCQSKPASLASRVNNLQVLSEVDEFLRKKYLYWLEGLSLCKSVGKDVASMETLWSLMQEMRDQNRLAHLVQDARRFIMYHKGAIEGYPLQTYASALVFSPTGSLIRQLFQHEMPEEITIKPAMNDNWSACLQTLEGHSSIVSSVAFSHDSARLALASASSDSTIKIWDASSGAYLQTLEGHSGSVNSVAFSHDSARLASASYDMTVKIWDASSGACLQTLEGHSSTLSSANLTSILVSLHSNDSVTKSHQPVPQGLAIGSNNTWISVNSQNLLWLPSEYRPSCSAVLGRCISLGTGSGKVWIYRFL